MPATYNGIVGLKPTRGRISLTGVVPFCWSLDTVGTLTRSVEDAALVLGAVAEPGRPRLDTGGAGPGRFEAGLGSPIVGLRIGVLRRTCVDAPDVRDDVRNAFDTALQALSALGAATTDVEIPELDWNDAVYTSFLSEAYALHAPVLRTDPEKFSQGFRPQLYAGGMVTIEDSARARLLQGRMTRAALAAFERFDVLAFPGQAAPAPSLAARAAPALTQPRSRFTRPWNIVGLPVLALPCGQSAEGLPLSIHLAGRPFDEATLLRVGYEYQRDTSWHLRRPPR
jgi:aspartyl-tRNA(Asn)/glutamyl-tRNA(Gln) amidotransferase subunit A